MTSIQSPSLTTSMPSYHTHLGISPHLSPPTEKENAIFNSVPFSGHSASKPNPLGNAAKKSKKYPYARPRRATTRLGYKGEIIGGSVIKAPLQVAKQRQNFSFGRQQAQRNVSYSQPQEQNQAQTQPMDQRVSSAFLPSINERADDVMSARGQTAFIPLKLPRVKIPPVDPSAFCYGRLAEVPPPYVLSHVKQASPEMLHCGSLYRPIAFCFPATDSAPDPAPTSASLPSPNPTVIDVTPSDTVRFGIPAGSVLPPDTVFRQLGGLEPTHCLAVRPRSRYSDGHPPHQKAYFGTVDNAEDGEVGRMIPIHQMVYASQCAYFPRPLIYVPASQPAPTLTSPFSPTFTVISSASASTSQFPISPLSPISTMTGLASAQEQVDRHGETEDAPRRDIEAQMNPGGAQRRGSDASDCTVTSPSTLPVIVEELNPSFELDPQLNTATPTPPGNNNMNGQPQISASTTPVSDTIDPENAGTRSLASIVDLPLVHVSVPFPSMMAPLHGWLYNPSPPILLASLLDIPRDAREPQDDSTNTSSTSLPPAVRRLSALSVHSIFVRMQRIHKLWSNTVALGVIDEMLWKVMDRAWDCFVSALKLKGGEAVYEVSLETASRGEWGLDSNSEVVRKFSMATIRDANSSAGSVSSTSS